MLARFALHIQHHLLFNILSCAFPAFVLIVKSIPGRHPPGVVIGLTAHHDSIDLLQLLLHYVVGLDAAVNGDCQARKVTLELSYDIVAQRRDFTVFLG